MDGSTFREILGFPKLSQLFPIPENWDVVFAWMPILLFLSVAVLLIRRFIKNKIFAQTDWYLFVTLLMSMLTYIQVVINPVFARLLEVGITIYILGAYIIAMAFKSVAQYLDRAITHKSIRMTLKLGVLTLLLSFPAWFATYGLTQKFVSDRIVAMKHPHLVIQSDSDIWLSRKRTERRIKSLLRCTDKKSIKNANFLVLENALYYFYSDLDGLSKLKLTIKHLKEKKLVSDLENLQPEFVAIESWAYCSLRLLSKSFQDWFQDRYRLTLNEGHFDIYVRAQKNNSAEY